MIWTSIWLLLTESILNLSIHSKIGRKLKFSLIIILLELWFIRMKLASSYLRITVSSKVYYSWYSYFIQSTFLKRATQKMIWAEDSEVEEAGKKAFAKLHCKTLKGNLSWIDIAANLSLYLSPKSIPKISKSQVSADLGICFFYMHVGKTIIKDFQGSIFNSSSPNNGIYMIILIFKAFIPALQDLHHTTAMFTESDQQSRNSSVDIPVNVLWNGFLLM